MLSIIIDKYIKFVHALGVSVEIELKMDWQERKKF